MRDGHNRPRHIPWEAEISGRSETLKAILIAGPTASGKSALAMRLAERVGGVVINADSMQVYRDLDVITARPSEADMARVPHELYGFIGASDGYSVGRYLADAQVHYRAAQEAGAVAIFVGGTGLYFKALLEGLSPVPAIDPVIRQRWRAIGEQEGGKALHAALKVRDGEMARRLVPTDVQRLVRALEVIESTGRSLAHWQGLPGIPVVQVEEAVRLVAHVDREALYRRSDARFARMIDEGALFEVARLEAMQLDPSLPILKALGVRPLIDYIHGKASLATAVARAQTDTRHYIKRQLTWLMRNMIAWKAIDLFCMERNGLPEDILC